MTMQDHVIKGSGDFMEGDFIVYPHPANFDSHRHCVNRYLIILICHMIL